MSLKNDLLKVVPIVAGLALLQVATPSHSSPFRSLTSVKFVPSVHNVGGTDITEHNNARTSQTTQLPISVTQGLEVHFVFKFGGDSSKPEVVYSNPMTQQSMIQCFPYSANNKDTQKNKFGGCYAKADYLDDLTEETTVQLRFNSPGGGGNKYLNWTFLPPETQNGVKSIVAPGSVLKGGSLSADIVLENPAAAAQTLYVGYYPKGCFQWEGSARTVPDNSSLIGLANFAKDEVKQTVDVKVQASCKTNSGFIKVWYADPGKRANKNLTPDIQKSIRLVSPRR
ncbi:MAG: hypothetical protein AB8C02_04805 [Halioglobus sp.]